MRPVSELLAHHARSLQPGLLDSHDATGVVASPARRLRNLPRSRRAAARREVTTSSDRSLLTQRRGETVLEHFRRIYLSLQAATDSDVLPAIGITSSTTGEGRTTIATGVAAAMAADMESPIVLIEADLAHPGVHRVLGIAPQPGICEYLRGESDLSTALRQISDRLFVLPAGDARGEAPRLTRQLANGELRNRLDSSGAILVFDLPPILTASYGVMASTLAEVLAFVVRAGSTTDAQVRDALSRLDDTTVRGLVLNGAQPQLPAWLRQRV
ncbi:MAG: hypothetical protein ACRDHP_05755 [Ktedonobacterales bacterium]